MKKVLSVLLMGAILISAFASYPVSAFNIPDSNISVSEYDIIMKYKRMTDEQLQAIGLSEESIAKYKEFDFSKALSARAKWSDASLLSAGYSTDQIATMRRVFGAKSITALAEKEVAIRALSATMSSTASISGTRSSVTSTYTWTWSGLPLVLTEAIVTTGFVGTDRESLGSYNVNSSLTSSSHTITKRRFVGGQTTNPTATSTVTAKGTTLNRTGVTTSFSEGYIDDWVGEYEYTRTGTLRATFAPVGTARYYQAGMDAEYAHVDSGSATSISISISIGQIASISISYSPSNRHSVCSSDDYVSGVLS
jgi:hypothetical protein